MVRKICSIVLTLLLLSVIAVPAYAATGPPVAADSVANGVITDVAVVQVANPGSTTMLDNHAYTNGASLPVIASTEATVVNAATTDESAVLTMLNTALQNAGLMAVVALFILLCLTVVLACRRSLRPIKPFHKATYRFATDNTERLNAVASV